MRRLVGCVLAAVSALSFAPDLNAQGLSVEVRGIGGLSTQELAGAELEMGIGFGGVLAYPLQQHLSAYGGWDWVQFHAHESFAGQEMDFEETGYSLGLRFEHPLEGSWNAAYRLEAGGTYKHVEIEAEAGDAVADSGHGLGLEVAGGIVLPVLGRWRLGPTVRFRTLQPEFEIAGTETEATLRYVAVEFGLYYQF